MRLRNSRPGRIIRCATARVGHRGAVLLWLATINFVYGYSLITYPARVSPLRGYNTFLPLPWWGWLWVAAGLCHVLFAFAKGDRPAYTVAATLKSAWALLWLDLTVVQHFPHGYLQVVVWLFFAAIVLIIADWPEVPKPAAGPGVPDPATPKYPPGEAPPGPTITWPADGDTQ